ncbi:MULTISPECIES: hypothetical protein [Ramlibacter]|uniref:Uncharacterized protein n=1 Tax=Ramlibacter aquaticus TaxID=2780094 RepID=A0ABR9SIH8_9BURK|nr:MULTISPECIES: hypothetical protein [Ramlibacter]MBE7941719.1 hypothetical protein [Ramlibacter aquaticus]
MTSAPAPAPGTAPWHTPAPPGPEPTNPETPDTPRDPEKGHAPRPAPESEHPSE